VLSSAQATTPIARSLGDILETVVRRSSSGNNWRSKRSRSTLFVDLAMHVCRLRLAALVVDAAVARRASRADTTDTFVARWANWTLTDTVSANVVAV
jgi:hypothetical protein